MHGGDLALGINHDSRSQSSMAASADMVLAVDMWMVGPNTSRYLKLGCWLYPFMTSLALHLSMVLSCYVLYHSCDFADKLPASSGSCCHFHLHSEIPRIYVLHSNLDATQ